MLRDKASALDAISAALSFPDYFGKNLDALYDCLRDLSWLQEGEHVLIWVAPETLRIADPTGYSGIKRALEDAAASASESRPLSVVFTESG
ncbi:MAG: barnase inhibitor [Pseudonocardiaceae bacterium]|nr:barnase inhibitor [Pseudonocardiaceae bacterium]